MAKIKLKPKAKNGIITIKSVVIHPMETGLRKKEGKLIPANHIKNMVLLHNNIKMIDANISSTISKNPYFKFKIYGNKGDVIELKYEDNLGKTNSKTVKSK